jgi:hypothetical protein
LERRQPNSQIIAHEMESSQSQTATTKKSRIYVSPNLQRRLRDEARPGLAVACDLAMTNTIELLTARIVH